MDTATAEKIEKTAVEIEDIVKSEPKEFEVDGLLPQEVKMAEKHGLVKKFEEKPKQTDLVKEPDGEHKEQPPVETKEDKDSKKEEVVHPTFEDVEGNENLLKKYNANEQALYWKYKSDKKKRQEAQRREEEWKAKFELNSVRESSYQGKLRKISQALKKENLTIEEIQSIIGEEPQEEDNAVLTKAELKRLESEKEIKQKESERVNQQYAERIQTAEKIGKTKYQDFEELTTLANEVVSNDKTGTYKDVLHAAFSDTDVDEEDLVERVITIARLNPKYGKKKSEEHTEKKEDVDRAINNSKKKISSATVGSSSSTRVINYDDLTVDDAAKLTTVQWMKLPDAVRKRLLM